MPAMTNPRDLFLHELQDVYYAEMAITKALPTMIEEASDNELAKGLKRHLNETKQQIRNLEKVFGKLGEQAQGHVCPGIEGIKAEHDDFMAEENPSKEIRDLFLTGAGARTEHYEIAAYTSLIAQAKGLGEKDLVEPLDENLRQEKDMLKLVDGIGRRMAREARQLATK